MASPEQRLHAGQSNSNIDIPKAGDTSPWGNECDHKKRAALRFVRRSGRAKGTTIVKDHTAWKLDRPSAGSFIDFLKMKIYSCNTKLFFRNCTKENRHRGGNYREIENDFGPRNTSQ
jgi:hypothetical protein